MSQPDRSPIPHASETPSAQSHPAENTGDETPPPKPRLVTERAVFQPRPVAEEPAVADARPLAPVLPSPDDGQAPYLQAGEYRVPILYLGREELIAALPEDELRIRQMSDLEIEALALQIEDSLAEVYRMVLRIAWVSFLSQDSALR